LPISGHFVRERERPRSDFLNHEEGVSKSLNFRLPEKGGEDNNLVERSMKHIWWMYPGPGREGTSCIGLLFREMDLYQESTNLAKRFNRVQERKRSNNNGGRSKSLMAYESLENEGNTPQGSHKAIEKDH